MKAVVCTRWGPPDVLRMAEVERPTPRKAEVRVRIVATSVTASDCIARALAAPPRIRFVARVLLGWNAPRRRIFGMALAGEIESVGRNVTSFKPGDQVFGFSQWKAGCYAEYVCWPPWRIGAIGTAAVQLAKHFGATVTGVCSTTNLALVESLGADRVVDYTRDDFTTGSERYDVIIDAVGKRKSAAAMAKAGNALAPGGRALSIDDVFPRLRSGDLMLLNRLAESGALKPVIDCRYPLDEIVEAHRYVERGHKRGNVIVTVNAGDK